MLTKEQEIGIAYDAQKHGMDVEAYKEWRLAQYGDMGYKDKGDAEMAQKMAYVREIPTEVLQPIYEGVLAQREAEKVAEAMKEEEPKEE